MVKIIETTELTGGLTSYRTELGEVDTSLSLATRYEHYKNLRDAESEGDRPQSCSVDE